MAPHCKDLDETRYYNFQFKNTGIDSKRVNPSFYYFAYFSTAIMNGESYEFIILQFITE